MPRISPLSIFVGVDDPPPKRKRRTSPVESTQQSWTEYTRELGCEIAALNRENAALRADNAGKAERIQQLEHRLAEYLKRLYG